MHFDGFSWRIIMLAVYAVLGAGCVDMPMCAHRVGLWLSCLIPLYVTASKQCSSLNWNLLGFADVYRHAWLFT